MAQLFHLRLDDGYDIGLDAYGDLAMVEDQTAAAQGLTTDLNTHLGEWELDLTLGVDYRGSVMVAGPTEPVIRAAFVSQIIAGEAITELTEFELEIDARRLDVRFVAETPFGPVEFIGEAQDAIAVAAMLLITAQPIMGNNIGVL